MRPRSISAPRDTHALGQAPLQRQTRIDWHRVALPAMPLNRSKEVQSTYIQCGPDNGVRFTTIKEVDVPVDPSISLRPGFMRAQVRAKYVPKYVPFEP